MPLKTTTIHQQVQRELEQTAPLIQGFNWEDPKAYGQWLAQTYYMVAHSTRLVALAGAHAPLNQDFLHHRFVDHSKEERGHQLICLSDLRKLGQHIEQIPCLPASAAMYQVQYYWIQYRGAASFLGYTLALESLAETFVPQIYSRASPAHSTAACHFLRVHGEADVGHTAEAYKVIEKLSEDEQILVRDNLKLSCSLYRNMLTEIRAALEDSLQPHEKPTFAPLPLRKAQGQ